MWDEPLPQDHERKEECLMADIATAQHEIGKFFYEYGFGEKMSSVPQNRPAEIISSLAIKGNQSKTTVFTELGQGYRTTYGHFLSKGNGMSERYPKSSRKNHFRKRRNWRRQNRLLST